MTQYTVITFAPVQGFIERSRKLRDLFGASLILSYLSHNLTQLAQQHHLAVISPGSPDLTKGMPNRILIEGDLPPAEIRDTLLAAWRRICRHSRNWIEGEIQRTYCWDRDWQMWESHAWEVFWGKGDTVSAAMDDLENRKLGRDWTAANWIGESSSLSGTDAIAWYRLGSGSRNPKYLRYSDEKPQIERFYQQLSARLEGKAIDTAPEGKFLDTSERLSIPELVKRVITRRDLASQLNMPKLEENFSDLVRKPDPDRQTPGQWTGWFMGDGDKVGDHLKNLAQADSGAQAIQQFSQAMRDWGKKFETDFPPDLGRVIYAGGDDFLGVIYNKTAQPSSDPLKRKAVDWLQTLPDLWCQHQQPIHLSVGFVWAAHGVPQRDILQHCREAEGRAKQLGRNRITLRVVFNSGQYVQWTCPWDWLSILQNYRDREGGKNWGHIYNDLAQLKARHAIEPKSPKPNPDYQLALALMQIYFNQDSKELLNRREHLTGDTAPNALLNWIDDLITVGWYLCDG